MENATNSSSSDLNLTSYPTLGFWIPFLFIVTIVFVSNLFVTIVLVRVKAINWSIRLLVANILAANAASCALAICYNLGVIVISTSKLQDPSVSICSVMLWFWVAAFSIRLFSVAEFSIGSLLIVIYGRTSLRPCLVVVSQIFLWILSFILTLYIMIPSVSTCYYLEGLYCIVDPPYNSFRRKFFTFTWITIAGVIPLVVTTAVSIIAWCYVKRRTSLDRGTNIYSKSLIRFTVFLLVGNAVNFFGQITPALFRPEGEIGVYIGYSAASISSVPLPLLTVFFFKPLRNKIVSWTKCRRREKTGKARKEIRMNRDIDQEHVDMQYYSIQSLQSVDI